MRQILSITLLFLALTLPVSAQVDFARPDILSFESGKGSSPDHAKLGERSLKWTWKCAGAKLRLKYPVP